MSRPVVLCVVSLTAMAPSALAQSYADLVFRNAEIVTMDESLPSASAIAVSGDTIVAVGTFADVERWIGADTAVHDLGGRTIVPGINETHIHVRDLGFQQRYAVPGTSVIDEMARYGVIAAINPANLYFEGDSFVRNIGPERMARHTPYKTFLDAGIVMASGSDYPNNSPDPWIGMYQMVTRRHQISADVHGPEQRISLHEALKTFTINGAYLTFDDDIRGSLEAGKLADLVVLDADLMNVAPETLVTMSDNVLLTMVGGKTVYRKAGFDLE